MKSIQIILLVHQYLIIFFISILDCSILPNCVVSIILDMRENRRRLECYINENILPHYIVNLPPEGVHLGVLFLFFMVLLIYSLQLTTSKNMSIKLISLLRYSYYPMKKVQKVYTYDFTTPDDWIKFHDEF
jgi:hypothetical protein